MDATFLAIVNPGAGGGRCRDRFRAARARLERAGISVEAVETERAGHAVELARAAFAAGRRRFLAVGGDGTAYEVVNGLFPAALDAAERPAVGCLPLGTGNSFLRDFTGGADATDHALDALAAGRVRACDLLRIRHSGGTLFSLNLISLGFVAEVCATTNARFKLLGQGGYTAGVLTRLLRLRPSPAPMRVDGGPWDREPLTLVSFCNSRFTGGSMPMAPGADPCDGQGDLVRVAAMGRRKLLGAFSRLLKGTHVELPSVRTARFREVELALPRAVPVMIDGEVLDLRLERIDVLPGALDVLA